MNDDELSKMYGKIPFEVHTQKQQIVASEIDENGVAKLQPSTITWETTTYKMVDMPFDELLSKLCNEFEVEGYTPTDLLMYYPVYYYYEIQMSKKFKNIKKFNLREYIESNWTIDVHVIDIDNRVYKGPLMMVYHDSTKEESK